MGVEESELDQIAELEYRISKLEIIIKGKSGLTTAHPSVTQSSTFKSQQKIDYEGISSIVAKLNQDLTTLKTQHADIDEFVKLYEKAKTALESIDQLTLSVSSKQSLVFAAENYLREAVKSLEFISENEKYVNSDRLQSIPEQSKKIAPLESVHLDQASSTVAVDDKVQSLLIQYNQVVTLLSEKFVYWDSILSAWEQKVQSKVENK